MPGALPYNRHEKRADSIVNDIHARLVQCFATVFPDLSAREIEFCTQERVPTWDSVTAITLVNVIEEEFNTSIDLDLLPELSSFAAIAEYLGKSV